MIQTPFVPESESRVDSTSVDRGPHWLWKGKIPSLDGLRALAILLVVLYHLALTVAPPGPQDLWAVRSWGAVGVDLFFVISGFLITLLLIRERAKTGTVSLKHFYIRRAFRILPAYGFFLLGLVVLSSIGRCHLDTSDWVRAGTYTINCQAHNKWEVLHLWSLCVEEHFYLSWPLLFACVVTSRSWLGALLCVIATPFLRFVGWHFFRDSIDPDFFTLTRIDSIAVGCLLAFAAVTPFLRAKAELSERKALFIGALLVAILLLNRLLSSWSATLSLMFGRTVDALAFAGIIWICAMHANSCFGRLLNSRPFVIVGLLSYSIYLWQQPFLLPYNHNRADQIAFPWNLSLALLMAVISYLLVELPFLRLKDRFLAESKVPKPTLREVANAEEIAGNPMMPA
jgi:peptidoglycan/LPS O-acetylase OafA/YrhL